MQTTTQRVVSSRGALAFASAKTRNLRMCPTALSLRSIARPGSFSELAQERAEERIGGETHGKISERN